MRTAVKIISLSGSPRRTSFHAPPDRLAIDWSFIDASTSLGEGLRYDPATSYRHMSRQLAPAEIGCYTSHVRLWRELMSNPSTKQMIVMEDDVYADWGFLSVFGQVDWSALGIDYIKFFVKMPASFRTVRWHYPIYDRHLVQYTSLALGTGAYLVTQAAAARFEKISRIVSRPIDIMMDRPWATGVPVLGLVPFTAMELSLPSSISSRGSSDAGKLRRVNYLLGRVIERIRSKAYPVFTRTLKVADIVNPLANPAAPL